MEYIQGAIQSAHAHAFFFRDQTPHQLSDLAEVDRGCFAHASGESIFDGGPFPTAQSTANSRLYLNLGSTVWLRDAEHSFALSRHAPADDLSNFVRHDVLYQNPLTPEALVPGARFDVDGVPLEGPGADIFQGEHATPKLQLPHDFELLNPRPATAPAPLVSGQAWTFEWSVTPDQDPDAVMFVSFIEERSGLRHLTCVAPRNAPSLTVAAERHHLIPPTGTILVGRMSRRAFVHKTERVNLVGLVAHALHYVRN